MTTNGDDAQPRRVTLRAWAARTGRSYDVVRTRWRYDPTFPRPLGRRPGRGRRGGGRGEPEYDEGQLDAWLAAAPGIVGQPPPAAELPTGVHPGELVTLGRFARLIGRDPKHVHQYARGPKAHPDFPAPVDRRGTRDRYDAGELLRWWNTRPGSGRGSAGKRRTRTAERRP